MSQQSGFSLVEVLVAFAILALTMTALYQTAGTGIRAYDASARTEQAVLLAQSQMDRIVALRRLPEQREGAIPGAPYRWSIEELPVAAGASLTAPKYVRVRVRVTWKDAKAEQEISLERYLFPKVGPTDVQ